MMPKIDITGDGITLTMEVNGEYKPFVTYSAAGVQLLGNIADRIFSSTDAAIRTDAETGVDYDYTNYYNMFKEKQIKKAFNELEGEECCPYCKYCDECSGIVGGPNGPIYPACADALDASRYLDYEKFKRYYLGIFDKKEEINMNKVLELYKEREEKRIRDKYNQLEIDKYESEPIVVEFNEIEKNIKSAYDDLIKKYNVDGNELITKTGYEYESEFELSESIIANIRDILQPQFDAEITELHNKVKDIEALLSISDDKDYQLEVLKNYGLLDKKGNIVR